MPFLAWINRNVARNHFQRGSFALAFGYFEFAAVKPNTLSGYMRIAGYVLAIAAIGYAIMLLGVA